LPDWREIILRLSSARPAFSELMPKRWLPLILKDVRDVSTFMTCMHSPFLGFHTRTVLSRDDE
jgi:hypothetical protein